MHAWWRRTTAIFALGTAVAPWLCAGMVALHPAGHSGGRHHDHERDAAAAALHGHHHDAGTPDHQHQLTLTVGAPAPAKAVIAPLPAALARMIFAAASGSAPPSFGRAGPDPPSARRSPSVLRI